MTKRISLSVLTFFLSLNVALAADNIAVTAGSGETVGFDDISSVKYQRIKLIYGADNSNSGDVSTSNPFPIQLRTSGGTETGTAGNPIQCSLANTATNATSVNTAVTSIAAGTNNIGDVDVASLPSGSVAATTAITLDYDTGGGTSNMLMHGIAIPASGGSVAGGTTTNPFNVKIGDGSLQASVRDTGSTDSLNVAIVDGSGTQITSFGGGTQFNEDAAHTTGDAGNQILTVRKDTAAATAGTDGDYQPPITDSSGRLWVNASGAAVPVTDNSGSLTVDNGGTFAVQAAQSGTWNITNVSGTVSLPTGASTLAEQQTQTTALQLIDDAVVADDAAFTPATTKVHMCGFEFDDSSPDSVNEGDAGAVRMSANRNLYSTIRDAAGNERGANVNASNQLEVSVGNTVTVASHAVTNAGTFAVQVDGSALTALQLIDDTVFTDDAAFTPGTSKVEAIGFEADETATDSVDEGDVGAGRITLDRKLIVTDYAHTAGGESNYSFLSTAAVLAAEIKGSAGQVYDIECFNRGANEVFMRLYNQTGAPGSGDTANIVWRGFIPGNAAGAGYVIPIPKGRVFSTGVGIRVTGDVADNDNTALAANEVACNIGYK